MTVKGVFKIDVFDCSVNIIVAKSVKASVNYHLRKHGQEGIDFEPSGFFCKADPDRIGTYYIFFSKEDLSVDIYHHEQSHLVDQILIDRDIKPVDEVRAYLTGCVSRKFDNFFKSRKLKLRNKR